MSSLPSGCNPVTYLFFASRFMTVMTSGPFTGYKQNFWQALFASVALGLRYQVVKPKHSIEQI